MPTKINGSLTVKEDLTVRSIWFACLFRDFLRLHDVNQDNKEIWLKASVVAHLQHITSNELKAQQEKQEQERLAREEAKRKMEEEQRLRRQNPQRVIPSKRYHK